MTKSTETVWESIPKSVVQEGDIAVHGNNNYPIMKHFDSWAFLIGDMLIHPTWIGLEALGFTYKRKYEVRSWDTTVFALDGRHDVLMIRWNSNADYPAEESRIRVIELL